MAAQAPIPAATLRLGLLYGEGTAHHEQFAQMLRKRRLPVIGDGRAPIAFLHVEDAARAFADAVERDVRGTFDVVDDQPTPVGDFFDAFARSLGAPRPMRVPPWVGALGAGRYVARFLTTPMVRDHGAFTKATGWMPRYATPDAAFKVGRSSSS